MYVRGRPGGVPPSGGTLYVVVQHWLFGVRVDNDCDNHRPEGHCLPIAPVRVREGTRCSLIRLSTRLMVARPWSMTFSGSPLLRYLEEALAEGYGQLRVNGFGKAIAALRFPLTGGYVTISELVAEGQT